MSEESLEAERELTLQAYEAWNARDFNAWIALIDPEVERTFAGVLRCPEPTRSIAATKESAGFWSEFIDPWESIRVEITGTRVAGDTLVAFVKFHGVGRGSGVELTVPFVHLLNFRNRKLLRLRAYADRGQALEAAGLSE